jgi:hypothetical protein
VISERDWLGTELCAALHALSLDASEALAMQAPDGHRPAQLALTFGNAVLKVVAQPSAPISPALLNGLNELAALLTQMSTQPGELWTDAAVHEAPAWQQVRTLARKALTDLGVHREGSSLN